jgi:hypothetical protein
VADDSKAGISSLFAFNGSKSQTTSPFCKFAGFTSIKERYRSQSDYGFWFEVTV